MAAANAYKSNLESFKCITCRYTVTWGFATSINAVTEGRVTNSRVAKAAIYKSGRSLRFRIDEDAETKAELDAPLASGDRTEFNGMRVGKLVPFMTSDRVQDDRHYFSFAPRNVAANITEMTPGKASVPYMVLDPLHVYSDEEFTALVARVTRGEIKAKITGQRATLLAASFEVSPTFQVDYTLDLARGALPVQIDLIFSQGAKGTSRVVVPQIRECSRGRYFPERIITFLQQPTAKSANIFNDYNITELDVDNCPSPDLLKIDLPAGTVVCQGTDSTKFFKTRQHEQVGTDSLDKIMALTVAAPPGSGEDTAIVPPRRTPWWWYALGLLAVVALGVFVRRRMTRGVRDGQA